MFHLKVCIALNPSLASISPTHLALFGYCTGYSPFTPSNLPPPFCPCLPHPTILPQEMESYGYFDWIHFLLSSGWIWPVADTRKSTDVGGEWCWDIYSPSAGVTLTQFLSRGCSFDCSSVSLETVTAPFFLPSI